MNGIDEDENVVAWICQGKNFFRLGMFFFRLGVWEFRRGMWGYGGTGISDFRFQLVFGV